MILLDGHSLTAARKVPLESMSLSIKERDTTATATPADMTGITIDSWLKDDTNPGAGIVYRVRSIKTAYATQTPQVQLEHVVSLLRDRIMFGEVTPAMITGTLGATTCTAEQAVAYILNQTPDWTLGAVGYNVSNPYKFDGDSLFDALETVTESLEDAVWSYDLTVYPFKLYINPADSNVDSELRAGRNLRAITKTIDRSGMYTRFYPIGADDLHIDGDYVSKNTSTYGVIEHVETDSSIDTKAELTRWANERLNKHAEPVVTIDVEGLELADATGVPLDSFTICKKCRVPLPEFSTTILERIAALNYPDKINQKEAVRITLSNNRQDVTKIIAENMKKSGKRSRTSSKQGKKDHAWIEDTNDHVALVAEGIVGVDAQGNPNWTRLSQIVVSGTGIDMTVQSIQNDVTIAQSSITQNESMISMVVEATSTPGQFKIKAAEITAEINETGSTARINANRVKIGESGGTTITLNDLITVSSGGIMVIGGAMSAQDISIAAQKGITFNPTTGGTAYELTLAKLLGLVKDVKVEADGNNYKLYKKSYAGSDDASQDWVEAGTFSRATTASVSGTWSSGGTPVGVFTVSASSGSISPSTITTSLTQGATTWNGTTGTIPIYATINGGATPVDTGKVITVDASSIWDAGYAVTASEISATISSNGGTDPGSSYTNLTEQSQSVTECWYKIPVGCHGTTKNYRVKVNAYPLYLSTYVDAYNTGTAIPGPVWPVYKEDWGGGNTAGAHHQGTLTAGKYLILKRTVLDSSGNPSAQVDYDYTWLVPSSGSITTQEKTVSLGTSSGNLVITPDSGYDGMTKVTVTRSIYTLKCTAVERGSGNNTKYTFTTELSSSSKFSANTNYSFYRKD